MVFVCFFLFFVYKQKTAYEMRISDGSSDVCSSDLPMAQQALVIGGLLLNDRVVTAAVHLMLDEPQLPWSYWWAPLLGMVLWVPLFVLLDALRFGRRKA